MCSGAWDEQASTSTLDVVRESSHAGVVHTREMANRGERRISSDPGPEARGEADVALHQRDGRRRQHSPCHSAGGGCRQVPPAPSDGRAASALAELKMWGGEVPPAFTHRCSDNRHVEKKPPRRIGRRERRRTQAATERVAYKATGVFFCVGQNMKLLVLSLCTHVNT